MNTGTIGHGPSVGIAVGVGIGGKIKRKKKMNYLQHF
jgi:transketolase N-terminal domain/subunit